MRIDAWIGRAVMGIILNREGARMGIVLRLRQKRESFSQRGDAGTGIILNARAQK